MGKQNEKAPDKRKKDCSELKDEMLDKVAGGNLDRIKDDARDDEESQK